MHLNHQSDGSFLHSTLRPLTSHLLNTADSTLAILRESKAVAAMNVTRAHITASESAVLPRQSGCLPNTCPTSIYLPGPHLVTSAATCQPLVNRVPSTMTSSTVFDNTIVDLTPECPEIPGILCVKPSEETGTTRTLSNNSRQTIIKLSGTDLVDQHFKMSLDKHSVPENSPDGQIAPTGPLSRLFLSGSKLGGQDPPTQFALSSIASFSSSCSSLCYSSVFKPTLEPSPQSPGESSFQKLAIHRDEQGPVGACSSTQSSSSASSSSSYLPPSTLLTSTFSSPLCSQTSSEFPSLFCLSSSSDSNLYTLTNSSNLSGKTLVSSSSSAVCPSIPSSKSTISTSLSSAKVEPLPLGAANIIPCVGPGKLLAGSSGTTMSLKKRLMQRYEADSCPSPPQLKRPGHIVCSPHSPAPTCPESSSFSIPSEFCPNHKSPLQSASSIPLELRTTYPIMSSLTTHHSCQSNSFDAGTFVTLESGRFRANLTEAEHLRDSLAPSTTETLPSPVLIPALTSSLLSQPQSDFTSSFETTAGKTSATSAFLMSSYQKLPTSASTSELSTDTPAAIMPDHEGDGSCIYVRVSFIFKLFFNTFINEVDFSSNP
ncbi:unnamed protein product [Protopolystoma xenopodis]|uniref:Uncharacterized protein n=1 Tax=Protopolystoma xenopodis TaxID=117903 RepID=A0A3S4ZYQ7_9PLAT|nr:unnamed protein product [Protopolystoma xenopodis]